MPDRYPHYLSYLIRLWRVREKRGWRWRGSLESPGSSERQAFADLESLIAYLREQTAHSGPETEPGFVSEDTSKDL